MVTYQGIHATEPQFPREPSYVENDEIIAHALQEELSHLAAVEASGYPNNSTQLSDTTLYQGIHATEPQFPREPSNLENDEIIAHALQEELSHLAAVEASGYPNSSTQLSDTTLYQGIHATEPQFPREPSNVENDEIIAHALQEELSHLAAVEASGDPHPSEDHLQASIPAQDWLGPSQRLSGEGAWNIEEPEESSHKQEVASPCSSPERRFHDGSEDVYAYPELSDEFSVWDGEIGKRLTPMSSVPHIPRINRDVPTVDEVTTDHQRLLDRLMLYGLSELKIPGDGNCQFRALSDQFYRTPEHHAFVRQQVVNQLTSEQEIYEGYVPMAYDEYLKKVVKSGEWGDHVTLQAAADSYGVKICVVTSLKDTCFIEILPKVQHAKRVIFLSFWAEVHYNSIYPEGGKV